MKPIKLDKIDYKILWHLDYNARMSLSELAKKVRISKQNLNYRINKLVDENVILGFMSAINLHKLGYLTYRVYIRFGNVKSKKEKEIIDFFKKQNTIWVVSLSGSWDLEVVYVARNFIHFNNLFKKAKEVFGDLFSKCDISMAANAYHYKRDYLLNKKRDSFVHYYYGSEPENKNIDDTDIQILTELSKSSRQSNKKIGDKIGVSYHTVKKRINHLEKNGIIQAHRIFIDLNKIGRKFFKVQLVLKNHSKAKEKELYSFCSQNNIIVYLTEVVGRWQLEVETEVENTEQFNMLLREIRNKFSDLIVDYSILQVTQEHKINYFPSS